MKRTYLTLIVLMLVVGFAAVSANLVLSGTLKLGFNSEDFEEGVIFTKVNPINGTASIQENNKTIDYTTNKLDEIGEESVLDYVLTNKSNQYDAEVTIECSLNNDSSTYEDYIELSNEDISGSFTLSAGETKDGRVKVKLKKSYVASDNTQIEFTCTIVATAKEKEETVEYKPETIYTETALNGADPVLEGNGISTVSLEEKEEKKLIPVNISDNGTVTYADITEKWYDYENQQWANAVILSNYSNIPKVGDVIPEEDIESYFVWIPKFKYKLWNVEQKEGTIDQITDMDPHSIEIKFGMENTEDVEGTSCKTPLNNAGTQALSGDIGKCHNDAWMTHPAFITIDIPGFWAAKFETGYKNAIDTKTAQTNSVNSSYVVIKPNVYSWRSILIENTVEVSYNYARNLDSHLMKNTEWGAVAILSHSEYGINNEIAINNNSDYKTGYATLPTVSQSSYPGINGNTESSTQAYNTEAGYLASTTGNISGVYDMSGGSHEVVAAYLDGSKQLGEYGEKYFDVYNSNSTETSYQNMILGDATGEMGPFVKYIENNTTYYRNSWYSDYSHFVMSSHPYFIRGGHHTYGIQASQFVFRRFKGDVDPNVGFRIVLSPQ